jgi:hypothetical protein
LTRTGPSDRHRYLEKAQTTLAQYGCASELEVAAKLHLLAIKKSSSSVALGI